MLHEYRVNHELAPGRWNLLHGSPGTFGIAGRQIQVGCSSRVHALQPDYTLKPTGGNRLPGDWAGSLRGAPCPKAEAAIILARTAQRVTGSHDSIGWYPHPELNRDQRFRKPPLYPFELWGRPLRGGV